MIVRRTERVTLIWGRRQRRSGRGGDHVRVAGAPVGEALGFSANARARRHGGPCQDRALYACSCGYVFDALVSTSVDCPACGDTQAW